MIFVSSLHPGAMENWGLLLFDEKRFLVNPSTEGEYEKQECRNVICHEVVRGAWDCLVLTRLMILR